MPDYAKTMARLQDEELFRIAQAEPHTEYEPEAIKAAQSEIDRRGISEEEKRAIGSQIAHEQDEEIRRPQAQLSNVEMVGFLFIGPLLLISIPLAVMLGAKGYPQKARGAFGAILLSYPLYLLLLGVLAFFVWLFGL
jgi:hypothetical protein